MSVCVYVMCNLIQATYKYCMVGRKKILCSYSSCTYISNSVFQCDAFDPITLGGLSQGSRLVASFNVVVLTKWFISAKESLRS